MKHEPGHTIRSDRLWEDRFCAGNLADVHVDSRPELLIPAQGCVRPPATFIRVDPLTTRAFMKTVKTYGSWAEAKEGHLAMVAWVRLLDDDAVLEALKSWKSPI